jgi:predicted dehydrogenase
MARRVSRRRFLQTSALAGAGFWLHGLGTSPLQAARELADPMQRLNIACIGVGGKGSSDTDNAGQVGNIIALCDVDSDFLDGKAQKFTKAQKFADFREMLSKLEKEIDAVTVSTPDHTHAPASVMAMRMKKAVYCQKPLTHTVFEARQMREIASKMGVATQMGNQGTAEDGLREAVELIQAGLLGKITEAHVWTNRPVWPQAPGVTTRYEEVPVPKYLTWDSWIGPAPFRPYAHGPVNPRNPKRGCYHDFNWRGWLDFGTGALGDMACHTANMAFMALKLGYPTSVSGEAGDVNKETFPSWARVVLDFPARGEMAPVTFTWYEGRKDGVLVHPPESLQKKILKEGEKLASSGSIMVGEKGILYSPDDYGARYFLFMNPGIEKPKPPEKTLARNGRGDLGMKQEWVEAIKGGPKPFSNFDYAAMLTETILLGNIAYRFPGKKLLWDGPNLKFTNEDAANKLLSYEYRRGWVL